MIRLIILTFLLLSSVTYSQAIKVGLLWNGNISSFIFSRASSNYTLYAPGMPAVELSPEDILTVTKLNDSIEVRYNNEKLFITHSLHFKSNDTGMFKIRCLVPDVAVKHFYGDLLVKVDKQNLQLVNETDIEKYIVGVIESEVGTRAPAEYYKVQAILCRTYALSHTRRHEAEGFEVCDKVHCQVYKGKGKGTAPILKAVHETKGLVLVDDQLNMVTAAFHSNCGGQTVNSEDVWNKPVSYLKGVVDTFCTSQPNARWKKEMTIEQWTSYLEKCKYPTDNSSLLAATFNFSQPSRSVFLGDDNNKIALKNMREDLRLKSTYFSVVKQDSIVILNGRGYGHGVGLCQEGAIKMARLGHSYNKILHYYYTGVNIVNRKDLYLFRE